jgi:hypothetical protein
MLPEEHPDVYRITYKDEIYENCVEAWGAEDAIDVFIRTKLTDEPKPTYKMTKVCCIEDDDSDYACAVTSDGEEIIALAL